MQYFCVIMQKFFLILIVAVAAAGMFFTRNTAPKATSTPANVTVKASQCPDNPEELGAVCWLRSLDSALVKAKATQKPILILFQEVPGCSNCTRFGNSTLTHPLIVEAMEDLFVPLCIYNNHKGDDARVLKKYGEPSWNNPVVRIVDQNGDDLTARMPDFRSQFDIINGMCTALKALGKTPPAYLSLLREEFEARERGLDTATFSMYCFWSGEGTLGNVQGVIETEPGFQNGKEVVKVLFDPARINAAQLSELATGKGMDACSSNKGFRIDKEPKYYLSNTRWKSVPMTSLQACRANSLVGQGQSPESVLSPRQVALFQQHSTEKAGKHPSAIGNRDLARAWKHAN
jgi:hypothetical protein